MLSAAPGYHGLKSGSVWTPFAALRSMMNFLPDMCLATFQPQGCSKPDMDFFDTIFGKALEVEGLRLPTDPWILRCQPALPSPRFSQRPMRVDGIRVEDFIPS